LLKVQNAAEMGMCSDEKTYFSSHNAQLSGCTNGCVNALQATSDHPRKSACHARYNEENTKSRGTSACRFLGSKLQTTAAGSGRTRTGTWSSKPEGACFDQKRPLWKLRRNLEPNCGPLRPLRMKEKTAADYNTSRL